MSNAVVCYGCAPGDDVPTHMREFIINSTQGFYPAKCNADDMELEYSPSVVVVASISRRNHEK